MLSLVVCGAQRMLLMTRSLQHSSRRLWSTSHRQRPPSSCQLPPLCPRLHPAAVRLPAQSAHRVPNSLSSGRAKCPKSAPSTVPRRSTSTLTAEDQKCLTCVSHILLHCGCLCCITVYMTHTKNQTTMHRFWGTLLVLALTCRSESIAEPQWSYDNQRTWPGVCTTSTLQSPLDFRAVQGQRSVVIDRSLSPLYLTTGCRFSYPRDLQLENNFRTIEVRLPPRHNHSEPNATRCMAIHPVSKLRYEFVRLHFHIHGEHRFAGREQDAEMHLVFADQGNLMVLAVPLRVTRSQSSTLLEAVLTSVTLPVAGEKIATVLKPQQELDALLPQWDAGYITYTGSLTTPPCTEGVEWVVFTSVQYMSRAAYEKLNTALNETMGVGFSTHGNTRATQPLHGRRPRRYFDASARARWIIDDHGPRRLPHDEERSGSGSGPSRDVHPYFSAVSAKSNGDFVDAAILLVVALLCAGALGCFIHFRTLPKVNSPTISRIEQHQRSYGSITT